MPLLRHSSNLTRAWSVNHDMAPPQEAGPAGIRSVATVTAALTVNAPPRTVYDFLERLPNHTLIGGHGLRLEDVAADGRAALISLCGPLGIHRTASTRVTTLRPPHRFGGTAVVGRRTMARVLWSIERAGAGSLVTLSATIVRAGPLDRLLLALGGRWWVARSFKRAIALLGAALEGAAGETCARIAG
jgi:hypothetical protein